MGRNLFYIFLVTSFCLGAFFKQFDLFYPKPFVVVAFSGAIGLLVDYAIRIRHSLWMLVPSLLAMEVLGDLLYNAQLREIAFYIYLAGALLYPVYGLLFIRKGFRILAGKAPQVLETGVSRKDKHLAIKFLVLGLLSISLVSWEYATYFPKDYNTAGLIFKVLYLATFGWLVLIDLSSREIKERGYKIEWQILTISLMVIAMMYFVRFIFK